MCELNAVTGNNIITLHTTAEGGIFSEVMKKTGLGNIQKNNGLLYLGTAILGASSTVGRSLRTHYFRYLLKTDSDSLQTRYSVQNSSNVGNVVFFQMY